MRGTARQFALEHRAATAHAAVRLAEGLSAFHSQHITPSLAAFSASALVRGAPGRDRGAWSAVGWPYPHSRGGVCTSGHLYAQRGHVWLSLPNGQVAPALRQRMRGTFINVIPAHCEQQWQGNFLLRGAVENLPVSWAPAHVDWPRLAPQGPEVAVLGALLGGRDPALTMRPHAWSGQRHEGNPVGRQLWEPLCAALTRFDPAGAFRVLD